MNGILTPSWWRLPKIRIFLAAYTIFVISIWSLAAYSNWAQREDWERLLGEEQFSTASFIAKNVHSELKERMKALELTASVIDAPLLNNPEKIQAYVEERRILQILFNAGVFVTRLDGTAVAEFPLMGRVGLNYMDKDHIAAALKDGEATVGKPVLGKRVLAPSFAMTVPIRDVQGNVIGALAGANDLTKHSFFDQISEGKYGQTGYYLIVAPQYRLIVTASDKRRVMEALPDAGVLPAMDIRLNGEEGTSIFVDGRGVEVMSSAKSISTTGWRAVVSMPTKDAFAPLRGLQRRVVLAAIALTLLVGTLTWWGCRREFSLALAINEISSAKVGLRIANVELAYQSEEKDKRAAELVVANKEMAREKKNSEAVWKLSFYDPLTNLPNRRLLSDRMTQIMAASKRTGGYVALMMLDLDNFKPLNDLHGHGMGDLLLVEVGRRLMGCVREVDTVARFGGDEFVVALGELDVDTVKSTEQARKVAEKVRLSLSQPYLLKVQSADSLDRVIEHSCSASVGVVVFVNHELSQDDVLKLADAAMYQAKAAGRNTVRFYETDDQLSRAAG